MFKLHRMDLGFVAHISKLKHQRRRRAFPSESIVNFPSRNYENNWNDLLGRELIDLNI